jgi:hypothetical protein
VSSVSSLYPNEVLQNANGGNAIVTATPTYITAINPGGCTAPCISISQFPAHTVSGANIQASTQATITLNAAPSSGPAVGTTDTIYVYNDRYRQVAALYTNPSDHYLVTFTQDGDIFDLDEPVLGPSTTSLVDSPTPFTLASVPTGIPVEVKGRCIANAMVHIFNVNQTPGTPAAFPAIPGFDTSSTTSVFPYRVYTDTTATIDAESSNATGATFQCMTDGWVWHRGK